jgi:predicted MFS family arabinose efflux permease
MAIGFVAVGIYSSGVLAHLVPILHGHEASPAEISLALAGMGTGLLIGRIASGALLDHFPARRVVTGCLLLPIAGISVGAEMDYMAFLIRGHSTIYGFMYGCWWSAAGRCRWATDTNIAQLPGVMSALLALSVLAVAPFILLPRPPTSSPKTMDEDTK